MTKGFSRNGTVVKMPICPLARKYLGIITARFIDVEQLRRQGHDSSVVPFTFPFSIFAVRDPNWI